MEILKTLRDTDFGIKTDEPAAYDERRAARAVIFDKDEKVALLHASKKSYHKLPGGGVEEGEDILEALRRELMEEIGCRAKNIQKLGIVEEFRILRPRGGPEHQLSYCYTAEVDGEIGGTSFDEGELADGFTPIWLPIEDAIKLLESETEIDDYMGKFIRERDLFLLKAAKEKK